MYRPQFFLISTKSMSMLVSVPRVLSLLCQVLDDGCPGIDFHSVQLWLIRSRERTDTLLGPISHVYNDLLNTQLGTNFVTLESDHSYSIKPSFCVTRIQGSRESCSEGLHMYVMIFLIVTHYELNNSHSFRPSFCVT